jgi:hypothetical protein
MRQVVFMGTVAPREEEGIGTITRMDGMKSAGIIAAPIGQQGRLEVAGGVAS